MKTVRRLLQRLILRGLRYRLLRTGRLTLTEKQLRSITDFLKEQ